MRPTLDDARTDIHHLDDVELAVDAEGTPVEFWSNVKWDVTTPWGRPVRHVGPRFGGRLGWLDTLQRACRLWWASRDPRSVVLLNMGESVAFLFGLLRWLWPTRGKVVASHVYLHRWSAWKRFLIRLSMRSTSFCAVWSNYQARHAENLLGSGGPLFLRVPYKANHSQQPREPELPVGDYIFSGGNTERDYRTLFAAVEGLPIPVVVSCTSNEVLAGLTVPNNIIVVAAREPNFRRLMAGARIVALCIRPGLMRGAGEATFLNAMWHGRPVIVADDGSASEYLDDGVNGFVVPAGDVAGLRRRLLQLWHDDELCRRIGEAGRDLVEEQYTGRHWRERMLKLALLLFADGSGLVDIVGQRSPATRSRAALTMTSSTFGDQTVGKP